MRVDIQAECGCHVLADPGEVLADCDTDRVRTLLRDHGYVFFRGFDTSVEEFDEFTSRFGECEEIRSVHYPPGGEALGYHAEDAYNPYRPDALWFLCHFEGSDGGAPTRVVDAVALLDGLPAEWRDFAREQVLRFDRHWSAEVWQAACGTSEPAVLGAVLDEIPDLTHAFLDDGSLYAGFVAPMVVRTAGGPESLSNTMLQAVTEPSFYGMTLGDGEPLPAGFLAAAERLAFDTEVAVGWERHDVALIDNARMMHRRAEYSGTDRDLRARHCRDLFGSAFPPGDDPVRRGARTLLQGDAGDPVRVGRPQPQNVG